MPGVYKENSLTEKQQNPIEFKISRLKTLTAPIAGKLYDQLEGQCIIEDEQKGCQRSKREPKDHLLIDKIVLKDCKIEKPTWL